MQVKPRVYTSIGTPQIVFERVGKLGNIASFSIPPEIVADTAIECLRWAFHNSKLTEEQTKVIIEFGELLSGVTEAKLKRKLK